ncbi:16S rRNA (uracil(1498)-N(3))-methyltransferase [Psychrobacter aestuarii]|uniref:Ribosomal RNA small subunit methyltransferase E n=1 Tax=Psychrobacter aestuarii TaxID=556327 RepID=A0ABP3FQA7_9GAMM|nr:16S rRNA (uracil(1498)-N(3))-methyltransferase [Psychrobacter aestuarii]
MNCLLLPSAAFIDSRATITAAAQLMHIREVLKAGVGETLKVGMLGGKLGTGVIETISERAVHLSDVTLTHVPPPKLDITVVLALPRPKVLRRLIMDMTALGVRDIVLVNSYRTEKSYWQSPQLARIDEFVLEGLQQGVDTVLPRIHMHKRFKPFVEDVLPDLMTRQGIVAHPYAKRSLAQYIQSTASQADLLPDVLCIGAEGGWIDYEVALLTAHGCTALHMGARILRTEAAVNALLGQWLLHQNP